MAVTSLRSYGFAGIGGRLRVTEKCTFLDGVGDQRYLLVWPAHRTRWDAEAQEIVFQLQSGDLVRIQSGQAVRLGGGLSRAPEASQAPTDLVVPPAASCNVSDWWYVGDVEED